ncbi:hypothetical protein [Porphyrobacter sp. LM 6]|uniref:hypothetical protein n=1 Tax=Porphyrobacter sp. LM 6 TaxID=1896196 RepID=UPI000846FF53|nr:hypothetical protein [Porphyrobacter sp. LM 6]AOL95346.1 hypothetical protein BG023_112434 [Porphyrobacter sp. LM 6]
MDGCELERVTPSGLIEVRARDGDDNAVWLNYRLTGEEDLVGADGSTARLDLWGQTEAPITREAIPGLLDNLMVTLHFGDAAKVDAPALVYYTRDGAIPLDVAPAKLWYPAYTSPDGRLEVVVTFDDLERHMAWEEGEEPAKVLSWIVKRIGASPDDESVIDSGEVPMSAIREARAAMGAALERVVEAQKNAPC